MHGLGMYVVQRGNAWLVRGHEWEDIPPNVRLTNGQYASYWNAILFNMALPSSPFVYKQVF